MDGSGNLAGKGGGRGRGEGGRSGGAGLISSPIQLFDFLFGSVHIHPANLETSLFLQQRAEESIPEIWRRILLTPRWCVAASVSEVSVLRRKLNAFRLKAQSLSSLQGCKGTDMACQVA